MKVRIKNRKMRKNKKGWLRILEAFIAIMLVASVLIILYARTTSKSRSKEVYKLEEVILNEIASNPELRQDVLNNKSEGVINFSSYRIPAGFNFTIRICELEDICSLPYYKEEVFARERVVSANLTAYKPRKIKIFMWRAS